jgi:hypothetical protein
MAVTYTDDTPDPNDFDDASPCPIADKQLRKLARTLRRHGIARVVVQYEGSGDSGCIGEIACVPESASVPIAVEAQLCDVAENYGPDGYDNNEGGYGSLTIYVDEGLAALTHYERFEDSVDMGVHTAMLPKRLAGRLANLGVTTITARFDGSDDAGTFEDITAEPETAALDRARADDVENFLLGKLPGGWDNNEGGYGYGEFTVDVASREVTVDANWCVEKESDATNTQWRWRRQKN